MNFLIKNFFIYGILFSCNSVLVCMNKCDSTELIKIIRSFDKQENVLEKVKFCVNRGADVKGQDQFGKTALFYALTWPDDAISKVLINTSESLIEIKDNEGDTALFCAIKSKNVPKAKLLIDNGAKVGINGKEGSNRHALKLVIDGACFNQRIYLDENKDKTLGGYSSWESTGELIQIVGEASSVSAVRKAKKCALRTIEGNSLPRSKNKFRDHYAYRTNIVRALSKIENQKLQSAKKRKHSDDGYTQVKKAKTDVLAAQMQSFNFFPRASIFANWTHDLVAELSLDDIVPTECSGIKNLVNHN